MIERATDPPSLIGNLQFEFIDRIGGWPKDYKGPSGVELVR